MHKAELDLLVSGSDYVDIDIRVLVQFVITLANNSVQISIVINSKNGYNEYDSVFCAHPSETIESAPDLARNGAARTNDAALLRRV